MPRPAVFLDRDGVINVEVEYLRRVEDVRLIPGSAAAIASLNAAGVPVVVVTNQSGLARGLFALADLALVTERLAELLAAEGARVDASYHCPHHPAGAVAELAIVCRCRKPAPGMLLDAARDLDLDLARSILVGDTAADVGAARAAGAAAVLVRTGHGTRADPTALGADAVFADLAAALPWIRDRVVA